MQINESYEEFKHSVIEQFPYDLDLKSYITENLDTLLKKIWKERNSEISTISSNSDVEIVIWEYIQRGVSLVSEEITEF